MAHPFFTPAIQIELQLPRLRLEAAFSIYTPLGLMWQIH
jgi:hypothetical protein